MAGHGVGLDTPCGQRLTGAFLNAPGADPSSACFQVADAKRAGFRAILRKQPLFQNLFLFSSIARLQNLHHEAGWYADADFRSHSIGTRLLVFFFFRHFRTLMALLALPVLLIPVVHASALILWPVASVIRRFGSGWQRAARQVGHPRLTAAVIAISLGFSLSVGAGIDIIGAMWILEVPFLKARCMPLPLANGVADGRSGPPFRLLLVGVAAVLHSAPHGCRHGIRPVSCVAIVAEEVVDGVRSRALQHRGGNASLETQQSQAVSGTRLKPRARA